MLSVLFDSVILTSTSIWQYHPSKRRRVEVDCVAADGAPLLLRVRLEFVFEWTLAVS